MSQFTKRLIGWLVQRRGWMMLGGCIALASYFRFWHLSMTPPALASAEAVSGLTARTLAEHFSLAALGHVLLGREALFTLLEALSVAVFGHTEIALRVVPAALGVLAVVTTYLWAKAWWGRRVALIAALVMAVTPWAVILERTAYSAVTVIVIATLGLWLGTKARWTGSWIWSLAAGIVMGLGVYAYPGGWPLLALVTIAVMVGLVSRRPKLAVSRPLIYIGTLVVVAMPFIFGLGVSSQRLIKPPVANVLDRAVSHGNPAAATITSLTKTILMVNFHGDENFAHNIGGEPQLNIFVGIMAVFGLLIALTMLNRPRYGLVLGLLVTALIPGVIGAGTAPDALRTLPALVSLAALAGLGIDYMINYWYKTFPVNSAARTTGLASMLLLLGLSVYHGYTAYFVAWADAPATFDAQGESATAMAKFIASYPTNKNRLVIAENSAYGVISYIAKSPDKLKFIGIDELAGLPESVKPAQIIIQRSKRDAAVAAIKIKFVGGQLRPHYSDHSDEEIFDVYETTK